MAYTPDYLAWRQRVYPGWTDDSPDMISAYQEQQGKSPTGGSATGGSSTPGDLATLFRGPSVTLPRAEEAKGKLRDLQLSGVSGLETLLAEDPQKGRDALKNALFANASEPINYEADRAKREGLETMFGRNMGVSSATGDYVIAPVERNRALALERAANDAFVQANTLANQNAQTRAGLLGQAFNQGTTGLQADTNVENADAARAQQAIQAGYQTGLQQQENQAARGQQESQYTRSLENTRESFAKSLAQQEKLQNASFANAEKIASEGRIASGIGGGLSGLASLFGPSIDRTMKGWGY